MHSLSIFSSINWKPKILPNISPKHTSVYNSHLHAILWSQSLKQRRTNFLISTFSFSTKLLMYVDSIIFSLIAIVLEWIFPEHVQQFFQYLLLFIKWINKGNAKALLNLPAPICRFLNLRKIPPWKLPPGKMAPGKLLPSPKKKEFWEASSCYGIS